MWCSPVEDEEDYRQRYGMAMDVSGRAARGMILEDEARSLKLLLARLEEWRRGHAD